MYKNIKVIKEEVGVAFIKINGKNNDCFFCVLGNGRTRYFFDYLTALEEFEVRMEWVKYRKEKSKPRILKIEDQNENPIYCVIGNGPFQYYDNYYHALEEFTARRKEKNADEEHVPRIVTTKGKGNNLSYFVLGNGPTQYYTDYEKAWEEFNARKHGSHGE